MKAVILAGGESAHLGPLTRNTHPSMLPVLNKPLLEHTVASLRGIGIKEIGLALSKPGSDQINRQFGTGERLGVNFHYHIEDAPQGTAGALRSFRQFLKEDLFLVVSGARLFSGASFTREILGAIKCHLEKSAVSTILVIERRKPLELEPVHIDDPEAFRQFQIHHPSADKGVSRTFYGIYLFNPDVLRMIPKEGYFDIKEQLLPALVAKGLRLYPYVFKGVENETIRTVEDYYALQSRLLEDSRAPLESEWLDGSYRQVLPNVWVGNDVRISPSAYLLGPVVLGNGCVVLENAQVIGPAVVGPGSLIGRGALLRESHTWPGFVLEEGARVQYCIAGDSATVKTGEVRSKTVLTSEGMHGADVPESHLRGDLLQGLNGVHPSLRLLRRRLGRSAFLGFKRVLDLLLSSIGLLFCLPVFLVISLLIKLDSPGPILFRQKRCGKGGREFSMLKFRTMVSDADRMQKELRHLNNVDGPVFKMIDDPRVTRFGKFLRETSLDELPQLVNVFKGEMSLVGPRPLVMSEMRFSPCWRDLRLSVKPGITGLWQIHSKRRLSFSDWISFDTEYVTNRGLWLDLKILFKTLGMVFLRNGSSNV